MSDNRIYTRALKNLWYCFIFGYFLICQHIAHLKFQYCSRNNTGTHQSPGRPAGSHPLNSDFGKARPTFPNWYGLRASSLPPYPTHAIPVRYSCYTRPILPWYPTHPRAVMWSTAHRSKAVGHSRSRRRCLHTTMHMITPTSLSSLDSMPLRNSELVLA